MFWKYSCKNHQNASLKKYMQLVCAHQIPVQIEGVWYYITPLQQYFSYIMAVSFIGWGKPVPGENHRPVASHRQTLSHNVASNTPRHERDLTAHVVIYSTTIPPQGPIQIERNWVIFRETVIKFFLAPGGLCTVYKHFKSSADTQYIVLYLYYISLQPYDISNII